MAERKKTRKEIREYFQEIADAVFENQDNSKIDVELDEFQCGDENGVVQHYATGYKIVTVRFYEKPKKVKQQ